MFLACLLVARGALDSPSQNIPPLNDILVSRYGLNLFKVWEIACLALACTTNYVHQHNVVLKKTTLYVSKEKTNASTPSFLLFSLSHPHVRLLLLLHRILAAILALGSHLSIGGTRAFQLAYKSTHTQTHSSHREKTSHPTRYMLKASQMKAIFSYLC